MPLAKGEYTNAGCTVKSVKPHKGFFEKEAGPRFSSSGGPMTLEAPELSGNDVVCAASTAAGQITAAKTAAERITFTGCELAGKKCTSEGVNGTPSGTSGVITTNLLDTRLLGPVSLRFGPAQVWTRFLSAEHAPYLAEFNCGGTRMRVQGSLSGVQQADVGVRDTEHD